MTPLIIFAMLAVAALAAWALIRCNRARKLAEQATGAESERLAAETKLAREDAMPEAKARDNARQQAEAEERSRKETEAGENARLAEEQRLVAEKLAAAAEIKRLAEEKAFAEVQTREAARPKAEAEAKRAEAEERDKARLAVEEEEWAAERRKAEDRTRAESEAHEKARTAAQEEAPRQAEETVEEKQRASEPKPSQTNEKRRPPIYRPPVPPTVAPSRRRGPTDSPSAQGSNVDLHVRVQLVFGRGGFIKSLALVPDRRDGMPSEIDVAGTQGELYLSELRDDCYQPVALLDAGKALLQGIEWRGRGDARRLHWVLGGREIYVLAPGDEFGLKERKGSNLNI